MEHLEHPTTSGMDTTKDVPNDELSIVQYNAAIENSDDNAGNPSEVSDIHIDENNPSKTQRLYNIENLHIQNLSEIFGKIVSYYEPLIETAYTKMEDTYDNSGDLPIDLSLPKPMNEINLNQEKALTCDICNKKFMYPTAMLQHRVIHGDVKRFKCSNCPTVFRSVSGMNQHFKHRHHKNPLRCAHCRKVYVRNSALQKHMKNIHNM